MTDNPPEDFIGEVRKRDAAEVARRAAIAAPPRPPRAKNNTALGNWIETLVKERVDDTRDASEGEREDTLNKAALRIGKHLHFGIDRARAERELFDAARHNGWVSEEGESHVRWKICRAIDDGMKKPAQRPDLDAENVVWGQRKLDAASGESGAKNSKPGKKGTDQNGSSPADESKTLKLRRLSTVKSRVPMWVWEYNGKGRIQLGTLSMFAGKPTAGKSTAVRWFAARLSKGELPGVWHGHPMKVAVVMAEEQTDAVVVPSLVAAGANLDNIVTPEIRYGDMEFGFKVDDIMTLREELLDMGVRALFIDPIMSTFGGKADIYRNNEVREKLAPFTQLAKDINGIVVGVTHLTKGQIRDVLGGMNGSAAFGEVPRAVFGFAPIEDGNHVFEQVKNSAGEVGLKLQYKLPISYLTADDGQPIDLPRFEITGETEISIADINPNSDETTDISTAKDWLKMYLLENQPASSALIKLDAKRHGDIQPWTLKRAMKELRVKVYSRSEPGKPHTTVWTLPDYRSSDP